IYTLISDDFKYSDKNFIISIEDLIIEKETRLEKKKLISTLLKNLSPRQREIIYLKFYMNFSNTEISNTLSINKQSVSNLLNRIFISLRKEIKKQ
ncbi:MAG: sigma-70 family RNA polymerase sigma factor, partial [Bacteroidales bacterium]|nr:sigma-70 family RNA polymerase sigma factor [Bacteroidales bacterium]